jgi:hypothetical protein
VKHPSPSKPSKHKRRRERRELYYQMIDRSLPEERHFAGRIIDTVNRGGLDIAHDGRPIKSFWRHYLKTRDLGRNANARACLYLLEKTYRAVRPKVYI